ncbi:MAG: aconitase family protein, partial [Myxococcales bacterium]
MDFKKSFSHGSFFSIPEVEKQGYGKVSRLPVSLRIVLESLLRNLDGKRVREQDVKALASWQPRAQRTEEIPFVVSRVLLQDFTGVPLVVDLAAMRTAVQRAGKAAKLIEPLVPVDLVIDHSVQVDFARVANALTLNMGIEFTRNRARYEFLKWGMAAFDGLKIVPPGMGIVHQVNLEYLAPGVHSKAGVVYPDSLVGTDSHTTMINGLGIVAWGVGGIEAEAAMLGQPVYFLTPDVVGVHLKNAPAAGVTATDVVLTITEMLRKAKVVGKFVEFFGEGASALAVPERATIANMAPEYGATMGYFPIDELSCQYLLATGRAKDKVDALRAYFQAQEMFGIPKAGQCDYTQTLELDLGSVKPSVAGPKRPQDRIELPKMKDSFTRLLLEAAPNGYGKSKDEIGKRYHEVVGPQATANVQGGGAQGTESAPQIKTDGLTVKNTN